MNCYKCGKTIKYRSEYYEFEVFHYYSEDGIYVKPEPELLICTRCYDIFKGNKVKK